MCDAGDRCSPQQLPHSLHQQSSVPAGSAAGQTELQRCQHGILIQQHAAATAAAATDGAAKPCHDGGQQSEWFPTHVYTHMHTHTHTHTHCMNTHTHTHCMNTHTHTLHEHTYTLHEHTHTHTA